MERPKASPITSYRGGGGCLIYVIGLIGIITYFIY